MSCPECSGVYTPARFSAMTNDEIAAWAKDPQRADTMPFGLYEPAYQKAITGVALVVRGVLYFRNGFTPEVRQALVRCLKQYSAAIEEYQHAVEKAAGRKPSTSARPFCYCILHSNKRVKNGSRTKR